MRELKFRDKKVLIEYEKRGDTLTIVDLMIDGCRDGNPDEIRTIIEKVIEKAEVDRVLYYALSGEEVEVYTEIGFDVYKEDPDPEFPSKCVMEYLC